MCEYGGGRVCEWMGVWRPEGIAKIISMGASQWQFESCPVSPSYIHGQECSQTVQYVVKAHGVPKSPIRCTVSVADHSFSDDMSMSNRTLPTSAPIPSLLPAPSLLTPLPPSPTMIHVSHVSGWKHGTGLRSNEGPRELRRGAGPSWCEPEHPEQGA